MEKPNEVTICNLEVVVLPNGEVISLGKTIGWTDRFGQYLTPKVQDKKKGGLNGRN